MTTKIEWVKDENGNKGHTWNPLAGCTPVSEACENCYAQRMARRLQAMAKPGYAGLVDHNGKWTGKVRPQMNRLTEPLARKSPTMYFVNSMSDLFHESVSNKFIAGVFGVMALCPQHTFQILTKRAERMAEWFEWVEMYATTLDGWPLPNVWIGVTVENQDRADERIPLLLKTPAALRFVSCEPLLGEVDIQDYLLPSEAPRRIIQPYSVPPEYMDVHALDWVIAGGETGPGARPMHLDWARTLRDECKEAGVPFFFKQWGEWLPWLQFIEAKIQDGDDPAGPTRFQTMEWTGSLEGWMDVGQPCWCDDIDDEQCVGRVGKKAAGRLLDGEEWNQMPERGSV